jgi:DnaJ-class molecular chaperone
MLKDYYVILGVPRDADRKEIHKAYRMLVRRCHPDACTKGDLEQFIEVQEAYDVLCDDMKRRQYDRILAQAQCLPLRHTFSSTLNLDQTKFKEPGSEVHNLVDDFFHHLFGAPPGSPDQDGMQLILNPEEAVQGGTFHIDMRIPETCPECKARSMVQIFCERCQGLGSILVLKKIKVMVPPGVTRGSELIVSIDDNDMEQKVRVVVCIQPS